MKRLHKKLMSTILAASMVATVLSGCGDNPGNTGSTGGTESGSTPTSSEEGSTSAQGSEVSSAPVQPEEWGSGTVKWSEEVTADGWTKVANENGTTLGYYAESSLQLIQVDGYAFKDLNRNGMLDTFEDWRVDYETRAAAIVEELTLDQMLALKMAPMTFWYGSEEDWKALIASGQRTVRAYGASNSVGDIVDAHNSVNRYIEDLDGIVIPAAFHDDPRSGNETAWPTNLGLAATFDPSIGQAFGELTSKEWRTEGISLQIGIQMDLATEPRWKRITGTFGEDPALASDMAQAVVNGYQSSYTEDGTDLGWGEDSVNIMMKHFAGEGAAEGGREAHTADGAYNVYPGNNFYTHLMPFAASLNLPGKTGAASAVMTNFSVAVDGNGNSVGGDRVATSFSKYKLQTILRDQMGFDGMIMTDFGVCFIAQEKTVGNAIASGRAYGVEDKTPVERELMVLDASVDSLGGEGDAGQPEVDILKEAYQLGVDQYGEEEMLDKMKESTVRLLKTFFNCGIVDNPYVTKAEASAMVNNAEHQAEAYDATLKSIVMLKNSENIIHDTSTETEKQTVYVPYVYKPESKGRGGVVPASAAPVLDVTVVSQYYNVVTDRVADTLTGPKDDNGNPTLSENDIVRASAEEIASCDFALVKIASPSNTRPTKTLGQEAEYTYIPMSLQYREYTANSPYVRQTSIAGDLSETIVEGTYGNEPVTVQENRSYYGQTAVITNESDLDLVLYASSVADKVVVIINASNPMVFSEFESEVDGIVMGFGLNNDKAYLDIISGKVEPSALLPMQMPANMDTVEMQYEDVPRDMTCHVDSDGNTYDFAYGLNWSGVISDARTAKYNVPAISWNSLSDVAW